MSEAVKRLRKAIVDVLAHDVRQALREGRTIAQVMEAYPAATKRFVEQQRTFLQQTEGLPDARRNGTGALVAAMIAAKKSTAEIMATLGITKSTVSYHRRRNKKVS